MLPSEEELREFWRLFGEAPLFARWPSAKDELKTRLRVRRLAPGQELFDVGSPPEALYLVTKGRVEQSLPRNTPADTWMSRICGPRDLLGGQALLTGSHNSRAIALTSATVVAMSAADLRIPLERDPELHEWLLPDKLAGRMRRIPLLCDLTDSEIRWLATLVDEVELPARASLPLRKGDGLWIIVSGQLEVTGPVCRGDSPRRITAGNFFLAPDSSPGGACVANSATAKLPTRLLHLPWQYAEQILALPRARELVAEPFDPSRLMADVPLFADQQMRQKQRDHLAEVCGWEFVPAGRNITSQGEIGHAFVILRAGQAVISAVDEFGRVRPRNGVEGGYGYGETSLLEGKTRDATVRAVASRLGRAGPLLRGVEIVTLDRRDFWHAVCERPELWRQPGSLASRLERIQEGARLFGWQGEGERIVWSGRGHIVWLLGPEVGLLATCAGLSFLLGKVVSATLGSGLLASVLLAGLVFIPLGVWVAVNYYDDYYVVTTRRVTRRDRLLLMYESRVESPIETVQSVTEDTDLWGRLFDYGELTIRTAAKVGAIVFSHVPSPSVVKGHIMAGKGAAVTSRKSQQHEALRQGLIGELGLALPVPERVRALGYDLAIARQMTWLDRVVGAVRRSSRPKQPRLLPGSQRSWLVRRAELWSRGLPPRWRMVLFGTRPATGVLPGQIVWRKHWLNLVQRAGLPALLLIAVALLPMIARTIMQRFTVFEPGSGGTTLAWLAALTMMGGVLWYRIEDYLNDLYVVTDDKIIDIEKRPLGLSAKRREGGLDRVQSVDAVQNGIWANLLDYGNVIIRTAAADEGFDFLAVGNPKLVQSIIFQKLEAFRQRQEAGRVAERQRELIEGLKVYHEVQESEWGKRPASGV